MTFATILPLIVQRKHTPRENALAPNLQEVLNETNNEASENVPSVSQTMSERSDCVIDTYRWTLVTRLGLPRPEGLAGCQRNSWCKKENLSLFTHPYGCFKPVCFHLFLWHIKTTSIWVWNNITRVSKEHNFHFWKNYCIKCVCEVEVDTYVVLWHSLPVSPGSRAKACILCLKECQHSRANHSAGNWEQTSEYIYHLRKWNSESSKPHWITNELMIHLNLIMPRGTAADQTLETGTVYAVKHSFSTS